MKLHSLLLTTLALLTAGACSTNSVSKRSTVYGGAQSGSDDVKIHQPLRVDLPYASKHVSVLGAKMHYVEGGKGDPVLFLHGMPTNAYVWRNVMPHVATDHRAIALDFVGFGKSDKPDIEYTFDEHLAYLTAFIDEMALEDITFVVHDLGSMVGLHYAMDHPEKVKAIVMLESVILPSEVFYDHSSLMLKSMFGMLHGSETFANIMVVKQNFMVEMAIPMWTERELSEEEMKFYQQPFATEQSRNAILATPKAWAPGGISVVDGDFADFLNEYAAKLCESKLPKLVLYAEPGLVIGEETLRYIESNFVNTKTQFVGVGMHYIQEDVPHEIGSSIANWLAELDADSDDKTRAAMRAGTMSNALDDDETTTATALTRSTRHQATP